MMSEEDDWSRFRPRPTDVPEPRTIFLSFCEDVAEALESAGFTYAKSGPHASRKAGDLVFIIRFLSDYRNFRGEHVGFSIHYEVRSPALVRWLNKNRPLLFHAHRTIAIGSIEELLEELGPLEWNIVEEKARADQLAEVVGLITRKILPHFEVFADKKVLARYLQLVDLAGTNFVGRYGDVQLAQAIDVLTWMGYRNFAERLADVAYRCLHPKQKQYFFEVLEHYDKEKNFEDLVMGDGLDLAERAIAFGLLTEQLNEAST